MSEIGDVLAAIEALSAKGERMALATIARCAAPRAAVPERASWCRKTARP